MSVSVTEAMSICDLPRGGFPCAALGWRWDAFERMSSTTKTLPGGRFQITGLARGEYSVNWSEPGVHRPIPLRTPRLVIAPASVRLTGRAAWIEIELSGTDIKADGNPIISGNYTVSQEGERHEQRFAVLVQDVDSTPIPSVWVASFDQGRVASECEIMGNAPARRASDLPPGTYGIRLLSGGRPTKRQTFDVTAGRTTEVLIESEDP